MNTRIDGYAQPPKPDRLVEADAAKEQEVESMERARESMVKFAATLDAAKAERKAKRVAAQMRRDEVIIRATLDLVWDLLSTGMAANPYHAINKIRKRLKNGVREELISAIVTNEHEHAVTLCADKNEG
jgi:predicted house-cleaning NTP pyrophosphatase (Maf/HAM1 superfamily)